MNSMENEEIEAVETITPYEAGIIIRKNAAYIRGLLRQGRVDWGTAVEGETGKWNYNIIKSKFLKYAGVIDGDDTQYEILKVLKEIKEAGEGKVLSMEEDIVKELSEKYDRKEMFIRYIIRMTIDDGYELNEVKNIAENFLKVCT